LQCEFIPLDIKILLQYCKMLAIEKYHFMIMRIYDLEKGVADVENVVRRI